MTTTQIKKIKERLKGWLGLWFDKPWHFDGIIAFMLIALAVGLSAWLGPLHAHEMIVQPHRATFFQIVATASAPLLGFIFAAVSIVVGWIHLPLFTALRDSRAMRSTLRPYVLSMVWLLLTFCFGAVSFLGLQDTFLAVTRGACAVTSLLAAMNVARIIYASYRMINIIIMKSEAT